MNAKSQQTQTSSQNTSSNTQPWAPQQPYLMTGFNAANNALNSTNGLTLPQNFTAQYTPDQISAFQQQLGYGTGNLGIANNGANAGGVLSSAGALGATDALGKLTGYTPQGGVNANIDAANQYVQGFNVPGAVQAAMRDANQEAQDVTKPQIDANAAAGNNTNSSRTAIEQGMVDRGLAQQAGDLSAQLQNSNYQSGLGLAEQGYEAYNNNNLAAMLGALNGGVGAANAGTNADIGSVNNATGLFNIANQGSQGIYNANQAPLTNQQQQYVNWSNYPFLAPQNFYNIIGANSWGNQQQGTNQSNQQTVVNPSTTAQIGGWTNFVGSLL